MVGMVATALLVSPSLAAATAGGNVAQGVPAVSGGQSVVAASTRTDARGARARVYVIKGTIGRGKAVQAKKRHRPTSRSVSTYSTSRAVVAGSAVAVATFQNRCAPVAMTLSQSGNTIARASGPSPLTAAATVATGQLAINLASSSCRTSFKITLTNTPTSAPDPTPTPAPAPAGPAPIFGVQFHGTWSDYTDASRAMVLDTLKANKAQAVRIDVSWRMLEPDVSGTFNAWGLATVDKAIQMASSRGLRPLVTVWMAPKWANGSDDERVPPTSAAGLTGLTDVSRRLAARYKGVVDGWEVWNEPNSNDFMRGASPITYAGLLGAAYSGFKAGDPGSTVVFGGPMYVDTTWVRSVLAAGGAGKYDVMGVHPYQGVADEAPDLPDNGTMWRLNHLPTLKQAMTDYGDGGKSMWFTEFGWSVHPTVSGSANWQRGVTPDQQADYLARTVQLVRASYPYVSRTFWYQDRAESTDPNLAGYGLVFANGSVAKALTTLSQIY